ncbi:MAG: SpoIIE family protein phosphatase [Phycisphaerae bacterium]|nr:SpoIIE family protein phosphatase [Phycisphaerae bacterium]
MKIRTKLLWLTLGAALIPMVIVAGIHRYAMLGVADEVSEIAYESLVLDASDYLQAQVDDYGRIINRDGIALRFALQVQANAVEQLLAAEPPALSEKAFFSEDFDKKDPGIKSLKPSAMHWRRGPTGEKIPIPVSRETPVFFAAKGVDKNSKAMARDIARLGAMRQAYEFLQTVSPGVFYWQYTALESGLHTCYPGKGGYPADFDPRKREWYIKAIARAGKIAEAKARGEAVDEDETYWMLLPDATSQQITLTVTMPVRRPDGRIAGVTGIDVDAGKILTQIRLPDAWAKAAQTMLVMEDDSDTQKTQKIPSGDSKVDKMVVVMQKQYAVADETRWNREINYQEFTTDDPADLAAILDDVNAHRSGVRRIRYNNVDSLCAYGRWEKGQAMPVVIVPYKLIVADGVRATEAIRKQTVQAMWVTGGVVLLVILLAVWVVIRRSRVFSKPILQLAKAGEELAGGNYQSHVDVRTGDELQDLGEVFNSIGPQLLERESMKRSLVLAKEIQQHLLPERSPVLEGFDIFGAIIYCDETGGDYFDFIEQDGQDGKNVGIAVGDITGHGIAAALLMASARAVLRSHVPQYGKNLAGLFEDINEHLVHDTDDDRFLTMFYGVLDSRNRSLSYVSGGHDPVMWFRAETRAVQELQNTGILLGAVPDVKFDQAGPFALDAGDVMTIGTDGIWEAMNPAGDMYGRERLEEVIIQNAERTAREIYDAVIASVRQFADTQPQADDITLVVIKGK